ncbi:MAG: lyase [Chloroflexota bacterium]|nr:lyase [Chloroflexota bacterium]
MTRRSIPALAATLLLVGCTAATPSPSASVPTASSSETVAPASMAPSEEPSVAPSASVAAELRFEVATYPVAPGSHPHDVAPAADGGVWFTGQGNGTLGWLDPETGEVVEIGLGAGSAPHGVIVGPDDAAWITDGGLNAIVRVDAETHERTTYRLNFGNVNLNTATFDGDGILWFTGQGGAYGSLDPATGEMALRTVEPGPYGIATTPDGEVYYSSLAGSHLAAVDRDSGELETIDTPTPGAGARRVWSDSDGRLWVTEWFSGHVAMFDPASGEWSEWPLPGSQPMPYAVYVDEVDAVWVTDFGANAIHRFDPVVESWQSFELESQPAEVRQLLGRPGEVWGAESAADQLVVIRFGP